MQNFCKEHIGVDLNAYNKIKIINYLCILKVYIDALFEREESGLEYSFTILEVYEEKILREFVLNLDFANPENLSHYELVQYMSTLKIKFDFLFDIKK